MGKKYRAAIFQGKGHIDIVEKELPDSCGSGQVIVKNRIATICGADYKGYAISSGPSMS